MFTDPRPAQPRPGPGPHPPRTEDRPQLGVAGNCVPRRMAPRGSRDSRHAHLDYQIFFNGTKNLEANGYEFLLPTEDQDQNCIEIRNTDACQIFPGCQLKISGGGVAVFRARCRAGDWRLVPRTGHVSATATAAAEQRGAFHRAAAAD